MRTPNTTAVATSAVLTPGRLAVRYWLDAVWRAAATADTLRERAANTSDHEAAGMPPLLHFGSEPVAETVAVTSERGRLERIRVVGPCRTANRIAVSGTEAIELRIDAPLRLSNDLEGTPAVIPAGLAGTPHTAGLIVARRHLPLTSVAAAMALSSMSVSANSALLTRARLQ